MNENFAGSFKNSNAQIEARQVCNIDLKKHWLLTAIVGGEYDAKIHPISRAAGEIDTKVIYSQTPTSTS
jgi:hypothetical protein